jgi:hypothetical protein
VRQPSQGWLNGSERWLPARNLISLTS